MVRPILFLGYVTLASGSQYHKSSIGSGNFSNIPIAHESIYDSSRPPTPPQIHAPKTFTKNYHNDFTNDPKNINNDNKIEHSKSSSSSSKESEADSTRGTRKKKAASPVITPQTSTIVPKASSKISRKVQKNKSLSPPLSNNDNVCNHRRSITSVISNLCFIATAVMIAGKGIADFCSSELGASTMEAVSTSCINAWEQYSGAIVDFASWYFTIYLSEPIATYMAS